MDRYEVLIENDEGTKLGSYLGPAPTMGASIEMEIEPGQFKTFAINDVIYVAGAATHAEKRPFCTTIKVRVSVEEPYVVGVQSAQQYWPANVN